ncbi:MAG TPA: hypothetical protein VM261_35260 [Kofleriaceae bacterium]|nr:hypothetical protein [Kofleriaceae bacterium]
MTAGDALLSQLPYGAEIVVEVDLARLRANPVVGALASEALAGEAPVPGGPAAPLDGASAVAFGAYNIGTPAASTITVVAGGTRPPEGIDLGDGRWALSVEGDTAAILATDAGGPSVTSDGALQTARAWAMPAAADGASLRIAARLGADARAGLADVLGIESAPAVVSVWGDVADDLAVIVKLADQPHGKKPAWLPGLARTLTRAAALPQVNGLGLSRPITDAEIRREKSGVTVTVIVAPGRLRRAVDRWRTHSEAEEPEVPAS